MNDEQFTTRLSPRFARQLAVLRAGIEALANADERHAILSRFERLAGDLAMGFEVLEQVPLEQADLEAERSRELPSDGDVEGLLTDAESVFSGARDNRRSA